jgi:hypothetical protein
MKKFLAMLMIAAMSFGVISSTYALPPQTHLKKDGTPDKRFKANKKLTKAGKPDMRYKSNNPNAGKKKHK